jgi:hypothetical protein
MRKWTVQDRYGNEIYLTQERWEHVLRYHAELAGLLDDLLDTLRKGQRTQDQLDPRKYKYHCRCDALPLDYNTIVVVVKFSTHIQAESGFAPNNFVITAWGVYLHRER